MSSANQENEQRPMILVVEDDATFRKLLVRSLELKGFETREAQNGLAAKTIFDLNSAELKLVISDIRMPELDGIGLLSYVRSKSQMPFILMTGFSEILETQDAFKLGATDFVAKPFSSQAIVDSVNNCLNPQPVNSSADSSQPVNEDEHLKYCPVHIDEFVSTSKLRTDIYIRLSEKKYIKVAHAGDAISLERLSTYKEKKVDYLHVTLSDFNHYVDFSLQLATAAAKSSSVPREKKLRLLKHTTEVIIEKCFMNEIDPEIVAPAKRMVEDTLALVANDPDTFNVFSGLKNHSDRIYAHSVAVSVYSCMVAQQHGWTSASTQFRVSISGLMHDIGKKEIPRELIGKPRLERTAEETAVLESHPLRGRDIILQLKALPEDISQIVYQHHENPAGTGYPRGNTMDALHPLSKLIATVDKFAELVLPLSDSIPSLTPQEALGKLLKQNLEGVDGTFLRRLMVIFKYRDKSDVARSA